MKKKVRIIPRLDVKGPNLVKGIHLEGLRVLGNPADFAKYYYDQGADELFFQDAVASLYGRNSLKSIITEVARQVFIPLTVGGGLRSLEDINLVLRAGADKVSINTAAIQNPELIRKAANKFGSSTIVIAVEAIKNSGDGKYYAYTDNGREETGKEVLEWVKQIEHLGAGELVLTSVDREGTGEGFDKELIAKIESEINIPLIIHGGCASEEDIIDTMGKYNIDGVCIASVLHYHTIANVPSFAKANQGNEGNTSFLNSGKQFNKINPLSLAQIKKAISDAGVAVRV